MAALRHIDITDLKSVADAREATRDIAHALSFAPRDVRPVLNIVTEIALSCLDLGQSGRMSLSGIERADLRGICIIHRFPMAHSGPQADSDHFASPSLALGGMKNLSDHFQISRSAGEVTVNAVKWASIEGTN